MSDDGKPDPISAYLMHVCDRVHAMQLVWAPVFLRGFDDGAGGRPAAETSPAYMGGFAEGRLMLDEDP